MSAAEKARYDGTLIARGYGIGGLSIERPSLHDAFVRIVGDAGAGDAA